MTLVLSQRFLVGLSIGYGVVIALLAVVARPAVPVVASVGALVIGGLWILRGILEDRTRDSRD